MLVILSLSLSPFFHFLLLSFSLLLLLLSFSPLPSIFSFLMDQRWVGGKEETSVSEHVIFCPALFLFWDFSPLFLISLFLFSLSLSLSLDFVFFYRNSLCFRDTKHFTRSSIFPSSTFPQFGTKKHEMEFKQKDI